GIAASRKIMKSLTATMLLVAFGWFVSALTLSLAALLGAGEETLFYLHVNIGWSVNFAIAMNYFVYFSFR
ncbi:hypothetical protein AAVH_26399, partial [Aphelenchoides avenae]